MGVLEAILTRRSIRRYRPQPIPTAVLEQLLTAATWAPSAHNRQPWRFYVITNAQRKHELAEAMGQQLRADLAADHAPPAVIEQDAARSYQRIAGAPALILLCLSMADMDDYPDEQRQHHEWVMAVQSVAMAGQNLLLACHALGLAACWMCAPLFCPAVVQNVLDLPADWQPQGLITLGYPAETKTKTRVPLSTRVRWDADHADQADFR
ncbi:MAG: nitroreductase family protein [Chloroflexota bacterium]